MAVSSVHYRERGKGNSNLTSWACSRHCCCLFLVSCRQCGPPWMTERPPEAGPESGSFYTTSIGKCPDQGFSPLFRRLSGFWCVCWAGWAELINEVWTPEASLICVPYTLRGASNVSESITQLSRQFSNVEKWANFWCANINTSQKHNFHVVAFTNCHWCERLFTIG